MSDEMQALRWIRAVIKVGPPLMFLAIVGAMALGRVGAVAGAIGLLIPIVSAIVSSTIKNRRLRKAMRDSDLS
jgi:hypothetical protein